MTLLAKHELMSPVWLKLAAHMRSRLDELRKQNDVMLSESETARVRGRIAQVKELLALANAEPVSGDSTDDAGSMGAGF